MKEKKNVGDFINIKRRLCIVTWHSGMRSAYSSGGNPSASYAIYRLYL